jgi:hypothetical protein
MIENILVSVISNNNIPKDKRKSITRRKAKIGEMLKSH